MTTKAMTLRLPRELAERLATVAQIERRSQSAVTRQALDLFLRARAAEPDFAALSQAMRDEHDEALHSLLAEIGVDPDEPISSAVADGRLIPPERVADYLSNLEP